MLDLSERRFITIFGVLCSRNRVLEQDKRYQSRIKNLIEHYIVAIHQQFEKLIIALRTAKENDAT
jgi:hypothetical protein